MTTSETQAALESTTSESPVAQRTLADLEATIAGRLVFIKTLPGVDAGMHAAMGVEQWQGRISDLLGQRYAAEPTLRLTDAILAFTSALAHLAAADGRSWKL